MILPFLRQENVDFLHVLGAIKLKVNIAVFSFYDCHWLKTHSPVQMGPNSDIRVLVAKSCDDSSVKRNHRYILNQIGV